MLRTKYGTLEEYDWRGIIALTVLIGYILLLILHVPGTQLLGVAVGLIVGWYFTGRQKRLPLKLTRTTENHPDYRRIRFRLIEALRQMENYQPAYDDMLIGEIAKTVIDIRTVDRRIDEMKDMRSLSEAVKTKAVLLGMLEKLVKALAVARRDRLDMEQLSQFHDTLGVRLKELLEKEESRNGGEA